MHITPRTERRVVIVDDSRTMQAMLDNAFGTRRDFRVVGIAGDATVGAEMIKRLRPDIVTIDLCMPYIDGAALLRMIADVRGTCAVTVSDHSAANVLMTAKLQAMGAAACLSKRELADDPDAFFAKINTAHDVTRAAWKRQAGLAPADHDPPAEPRGPAPEAVAPVGFPVPSDEARRLDTLHGKQLANAVAERQFDLVTRHVARTTDYPVCLLTFIDRDTQWLKSSYGLDVPSTPRGQAFCNYTICQGGSFVVPNAASDRRFASNPLVAGAPGIRAYAGHPIVARDGTRLGALCLIDIRPRPVSPGILGQLAGMAEIVADMIDRRPALAA